jgi:hypothetical protein
MRRYDRTSCRTGTETILTHGNVNTTQFGKRFAMSLNNEAIYAQPPYLPSIRLSQWNISANLLIVATMANNIYVFDADTGFLYKQQSFGTPTQAQVNNSVASATRTLHPKGLSSPYHSFLQRRCRDVGSTLSPHAIYGQPPLNHI